MSPDGTNVEFWSEVTKFELPAFCVDLNSSSDLLVCGSQCGTLKWFDVSTENAQLKKELKQEYGAVHSVSIDPKGIFVVFWFLVLILLKGNRLCRRGLMEV